MFCKVNKRNSNRRQWWQGIEENKDWNKINKSFSFYIVGDGKQSIYRWRGGEVEQFIEIPDIFKGNKLKEKKEWESKLNTHYIEDESENQNYRSRKEITRTTLYC